MEFDKEKVTKTAVSLMLSLTMLGVLLANVIPKTDSRIELTKNTEPQQKSASAEAELPEPVETPEPTETSQPAEQTSAFITTATEETVPFDALVTTVELTPPAPEETQPEQTAAQPPQTTVTTTSAAVTQKDDRININTATKEELMELDGIGEVKAQAIIDYRTQYGDFVSIDELTEVKGIGEKTLEKNRDRITV